MAPTMRWVKSRVSVTTMIIGGLFSISAILVVLGDNSVVLFDFGKYFIVLGFGAMIIGIGVLLWQFRKSKII